MKSLKGKISLGKINRTKIGIIGRNILKRILPLTISGGLSVTDSSFRYCRFGEDGAVVSEAYLRLPPGIVAGGRIKEKNLAVAALKKLRSMTGVPQGEKSEAVLSLPSHLVYSQIFSLPDLPEGAIAEAADLNIRMISPINLKEAYYGFQVVGIPEGGFGKDVIAAFIPSVVSDEWASAVKDAGFLPVATEFHGLSLSRLFSGAIDPSRLRLAVNVSPEGVNLLLLKNNNLIFDYFFSWSSVQKEDKRITFDRLKDILFAEVNKVVNFSLSRFGGEVNSIIVNAEGLENEIISGIKSAFPSIQVLRLSLPDERAPGYAVALGAAIRGRIMRSADRMISLSSLTVIKEYEQNRVIAAVALWRQLSVVTLGFLLLVFAIANVFLVRIGKEAQTGIARKLTSEELSEYDRLKSLAGEFNSLISSVKIIRSEENRISPFINRIGEYAGPDIRFTRFAFQSFSQPVVINGVGPSMDAVLSFHRRILQAPGIMDVQLPLSSVQASLSGEVSFVLSFRVISLDPPSSSGSSPSSEPVPFLESVPATLPLDENIPA